MHLIVHHNPWNSHNKKRTWQEEQWEQQQIAEVEARLLMEHREETMNNSNVSTAAAGGIYYPIIQSTPTSTTTTTTTTPTTTTTTTTSTTTPTTTTTTTTTTTPPPPSITWAPSSAEASWTDINGTFNGNLSTFISTANLGTVSSLSLPNSSLTSFAAGVDLPSIVTLDLINNTLSILDITGMPQLASLTISNNNITSLIVSGSTDLALLNASNNPITNIGINIFNSLNDVSIDGANLSENEVDTILFMLDQRGLTNGFCDLSGGTSSPPSSTGLSYKDSLITKGWDVTTNVNQTFNFQITAPDPNTYFEMYVDSVSAAEPATLNIDWGDGTIEPFVQTAPWYGGVSHSYAESGIFTVKISGSALRLSFFDEATGLGTPSLLTNLIMPIYGLTLRSFTEMFRKCSNLTSIPTSFLAFVPGINNITSFNLTFAESGITTIPSDLFSSATSATSFSQCFKDCTFLTAIPETLFNNNTLCQTFFETFRGCNFVTTIPELLFVNNTAATMFDWTFAECSSVTAIPQYLFNTNVAVTSFGATFYNCVGVVNPLSQTMFSSNISASIFESCFQGCTGLTDYLQDMFFNQISSVVNCSYMFYGCSGLVGIEGFQMPDSGLTNCAGMFNGCIGITGGNSPRTRLGLDLWLIDPAPDGNTCFSGCSGLENYASIPATWGGGGA